MNLIELHMLQSFPVNCLNRDSFGSPKSTLFGGVPRARVSSQCWKRAIRMLAREENDMFSGSRSKYFLENLNRVLQNMGQTEKEAKTIAEKIVTGAGIKIDKEGAIKNLFYFSELELQAAARAYLECDDPKKKVNVAVKELEKVVRDGVDISFFGRMVADSDLTLEGAAMFSHAISVNRVDNDLDFFTAVDDLKPKEQTGSAHMGELEFNTACYYRYVALNLDLLADGEHLGNLSLEERRSAVETFLRVCVMASPSARKNSMLANTLPGFVLGIARRGAPLSLANAFEEPIKGAPVLTKAKEELQKHWNSLQDTYGISVECEKSLPESSLNQLVKELVEYVK